MIRKVTRMPQYLVVSYLVVPYTNMVDSYPSLNRFVPKPLIDPYIYSKYLTRERVNRRHSLRTKRFDWLGMKQTLTPPSNIFEGESGADKQRKMFSSCHERGTKKTFWVPNEESNLRSSHSTLRCSNHWPTETPRWARSITKFVWHASCILLGSEMSKA